MKSVCIVISMLSVTLGYTQAPDTLWTRTFGGPNADDGFSVQQTFDGGFIIVGYTDSFGAGEDDIYLIKTDSLGNPMWEKTYGDTADEWGYSVQQTSDYGYIIVGVTSSFSASWCDLYLVKTNAQGDTVWTRTYGGIREDMGRSVQETTDGGYIVVGGTEDVSYMRHVYLIKTDANGDSVWTKTYDWFSMSFGTSVQQTQDEGYIITGVALLYGGPNILLIKTDVNGDTMWTRTYGGSDWAGGEEVCITSDGGYVIAGSNYVLSSGDDDVYLVKTDSLGDTLWTRTFGGTDDDVGNGVDQLDDGGYIITGYTYSYGAGYTDVYLIRLDNDGNAVWTTTIGGAGSDHGDAVKQTSDGGYIIGGGTSSFGAGSVDVYLIRLESDIGIEEQQLKTDIQPLSVSTIFRGHLQLPEGKKCKVFDITGRIVEPTKIKPGIYFIEVDGVVIQKVVKVR